MGIIEIEPWMSYVASFGGIFLTFLAGTEVDLNLMKDKFSESFLIGFLSFLAPFLAIFIVTYVIVGWSFTESLLIATALSETSIAIVFSVLKESGLFNYELGKIIMIATFITNLSVAVVLNLLFLEVNLSTLIFYIISAAVLFLTYKYSYLIFNNNSLKNKLVEVEVKYIFLLLLFLIFLANFGGGIAILPAFILGSLFSNYFKENQFADKLQTIAFGVITPIFFIISGMKVSISLIIPLIGVLVLIFMVRQVSKYIGVFYLAKHYFNENKHFITYMMSTGLTFGLVATVFGLNHNIISPSHYSLIIAILVLSAVIPSFIAQKFFKPEI